ncbi:oligopeptide/dipeptide ABC transporter ATP-binding protein [Alphaproteobacteria bacterium LSUCC0684]
MVDPIMELNGVSKNFSLKRKSIFSPQRLLRAVKNVSLTIEPGESFGIIGESGCGKSTLARVMVGLHAADSGEVRLEGRPLLEMPPAMRHRTIQYVFQDPVGSLNPRNSIRQILSTPLKALAGLNHQEAEVKLEEIMAAVNMPLSVLDRYPHEFSGGQAQRIGIARALLAGSRILVLDEPVSALDVSVQAQILELLVDLKARFGLTYIFISHDLAVIEAFCDRVAVMYHGEIVEIGRADKLFGQALHPYTDLLARTAPRQDADLYTEHQIELPDPLSPPTGCAFAARCPRAEKICHQKKPELSSQKASSHVACHFPLNR